MFVQLLSQNVRCFTDDKETELLERMRARDIFAACLQETWKTSRSLWSSADGYVTISHGRDTDGRGQGTAIVLSPAARKAWKRVGEPIYRFGTRIVAVRLQLVDHRKRTRHLYLASAYAPHSGLPLTERDLYLDHLQECLSACPTGDILIIGSDLNASLGVQTDDQDSVLGRFGLPRVNDAGLALNGVLSMNNLCAPTTFFQKHKSRYSTWANPRSGLPHQIDHFFMKRRDLVRVTKAATYTCGVHSDHRALFTRINMKCFAPKARPATTPRVDRNLLQQPDVAKAFTTAAAAQYQAGVAASTPPGDKSQLLCGALANAAKAHLMNDGKQRPSWFRADKDRLLALISDRNAANDLCHDRRTAKRTALYRACKQRLNARVRKAKAAWVGAIAKEIDTKQRDGNPLTPKEVWSCVRTLQQGPRVVTAVNPMSLKKTDGTICTTPSETRDTMVAFQRGLFSKTGTYDPAAVAAVKQRKHRGWMDRTPTTEEVCAATMKLSNGKSGGESKVPVEFYKALLGDPATATLVHEIIIDFWETGAYQDPAADDVHRPRRKATLPLATAGNWTVRFAQRNIRNQRTKPHDRYEAYKAATTIADALALGATLDDLKKADASHQIEYVDPLEYPPPPTTPRRVDTGGKRYELWETAKLKLLPKKGDLSLCKNWRGISLLDVCSKVFSKVAVGRMMTVMEEVGPDEQNGFRVKRGTTDGSFSVNAVLRKRHEHDLETWALFIDLVKAFDTVPHAALWAVLRRYGMPDHFINIIIRLHDQAKLKMEIAGTDTMIDVTIGVRQGSCEGPVLFLFIMNAAMETMEWPAHIKMPTFLYDDKTGPTGGNPTKRRARAFQVWHSLFADDAACFFETRADLVEGSNFLCQHLRKFGLQMHVGRGSTPSKSEAMFLPRPGRSYDDGDTGRFRVDGDGFIEFATKFKYLGSYITPNLTVAEDVNSRIRVASAAFGSLRRVFRNTAVSDKDKGILFTALITNILLYGCESWCLREDDVRRLRGFHRRCVRTICGVTLFKTWKDHIKSSALNDRLCIPGFEDGYRARLLRWAGEIARMPMDRLPRRLMTCWVANPRPRGRPHMTWGATLKKALRAAGVSTKFADWMKLAQDSAAWRTATRPTPPRAPPTATTTTTHSPPPQPAQQQQPHPPAGPAPAPNPAAQQAWLNAHMPQGG